MADTSYQPTPWLETMLNEEHLLTGLAGICTSNGWTELASFTKVTFLNKLIKPTIKRFYLPLAHPEIELPALLYDDYYVYLDGEPCPSSYYQVTENADGTRTLLFEPGVTGMAAVYYSDVQGTAEFDFYVAKHSIVRNASGHLFGMAQLAHLHEQIADTGCKVPFAIIDPDRLYGTRLAPQDSGMFSRVVQKAEEDWLYEGHTLYFYQLEKWIGNGIRDGLMITGWDNDTDGALKRLALDAEIQSTMWDLDQNTQALQFKVTDKYQQMYQSPIVISHTRIPQLEYVDKLAMADVKHTNWWSDSKVFVKGFVDGRSLMLILMADAAPVWDRNAVPAIPLYMGDFETGEGHSESSDRELVFEFYKTEKKTSTIITSSPMVNKGSYVKLWLMGDVDGDLPDEAVTVTIAGQNIGSFTTGRADEPEDSKSKAHYLGQFDITNIEGKNSVVIEARSGSGVSGYAPVAARMWLDVHIETDKQAEGAPAALFSGSALSSGRADAERALQASGSFDYDDAGERQELLLPMMKDYVHYPSNGIDSVMVKRTKYGARYQAHYIAWAVPSNSMPPVRENAAGSKHPRAWTSYANDAYKYQFNPSRYSDKAHSSRATLIHPEDGKYGTLRNVILVPPLTIMNGDELKASKDSCADDENDRYDVYSYYLVEGISPLTKRPATAFRPAGLGILKEGYLLPEIPPPPPEPPGMTASVSPSYATVTEGDSVKFTSDYSRHSPLTNFTWEASSDVNRGLYSAGAASFIFKAAGRYTVTFTVWNELGQKASASATIVVNPKPVPPPPPVPPPSNSIQCGRNTQSGGGSLTENEHEMGAARGTVKLTYNMNSAPDRLDVYYQNQLLASTNKEVAGSGTLTFSYNPVGGITQIKVVVTSTANSTQWDYLVNCPV
ncbi:PKD domain-containing protein ['Paenibacillus yunnanensis' Narsing Rao et al. 2020]|uniref:PKD domain-containing protein n=1 Tax=Paenibacillus tengchongensis TaxID=2608684 RepID=UPI00124C3415|nr:PKD domain-containing protein [Paenibacillus tengchongensis]